MVELGVLAPLSPPGWVDAGRHLVAGIELAAEEVGDVELVVRDTAGEPGRAAAAVDELAARGVAALLGEFHSVVAQAVARRAQDLRLPFLCTSAVLDALVDEPTDWVARLAPPQSRGWPAYADAVLGTGAVRLAVALQPGAYWAAGVGILREHLEPRGGSVVALDADALAPAELSDAVVRAEATALLLLVGHPEPAVPLARAVRADPRLADLVLGAPAGQPELASWRAALGAAGAGVPFLRYRPEVLGPLGARVEAALADRLGTPPSFVALEGYDAVLVLAEAFRAHGTDREAVAAAWPQLRVEGTRGPIAFSRVAGVPVWQWADAPIGIAT